MQIRRGHHVTFEFECDESQGARTIGDSDNDDLGLEDTDPVIPLIHVNAGEKKDIEIINITLRSVYTFPVNHRILAGPIYRMREIGQRSVKPTQALLSSTIYIILRIQGKVPSYLSSR